MLQQAVTWIRAGNRFFVSPPFLRPCRSLCHPRVQSWRVILCQSPVSATMLFLVSSPVSSTIPFLVSSAFPRLASDSLSVPRFCDHVVPALCHPSPCPRLVSDSLLVPHICDHAVPCVIPVSKTGERFFVSPPFLRPCRSLCHPRV